LHQTTRLALITGAPFIEMMFVLAEPLRLLLFNNAAAGAMLRYMASVDLFIYFQGPLQATLQALNKPGKALLNTFIGASTKLVLIVVFAAKMKLGINGVIIAICVSSALVTLLHWRSVAQLTGFKMSPTPFTKTFALMILTGFCMYTIMFIPWFQAFPLVLFASVPIRLLLAGSIGGLIYIVMLFIWKLVDKQDVVRIPWLGQKLSRWIR